MTMSDVIPKVCFSMAYSNPFIIEVAIVIVATPMQIEKAATNAAKFRDLFFFIPKKNLKPTKSISIERILNSIFAQFNSL